MAGIAYFLKTGFAQLDPRAALTSQPTILLGVPDSGAGTSPTALLQQLNVSSVFDLALSSVFEDATRLLDAANNALDVFAQFGALPTGILSSKAAGIDVTTLADQPADVLKAIDDAGVSSGLEATFGIHTVRDMALWPPYLAAKQILNLALNPSDTLTSDPEAPADLIPKSGEYPTERVFYSTLVFDSLSASAPGTPPKDLISAGPIDPTGAMDMTYGFTVPAEGALLTYAQSWYAQGVALGQLLHSVALAPGEATKIAMVDWFRRTAGTRSETGTESEQLVNDTSHARSISEVTSAVATEAQSGFSKTSTAASSDQGGLSIGGSDFGISLGGADSSGTATSVSSSSGRRTLDATMNQNITDATHQAANAVRNRRATVVQEVSETETVTATTRVVANYNHMHALSVQYYEVVQIYRVELMLRRVDKLLFVPLKMIDFSQVTLNPHQQAAIAQNAADASVAQAYSIVNNAGLVHVQTSPPPVVNVPGGAPSTPSTGGSGTGTRQNSSTSTGAAARWGTGAIGLAPLHLAPVPWALAQLPAVQPALGNQAQVVDAQTLSLPRDLSIIAITVIGSHDGDAIVITAPDGTVTQCLINSNVAQLSHAVTLANIQTISLVTKANLDPGAVAVFQIQMPAGTKSLISVPLQTGGPTEQTMVIVQITDPSADANSALAQQQLQLNRLYYNQVLWRNLDAATIALLLSPYTYKGQPILEQIDLTPVAVVANYLVFRMPLTPDFSYRNQGQNAGDGTGSAATLTDAQQWAKWLDDHGLSQPNPTSQIVPLPSGGMFAEAVLGRFNSAEKLDVTRFWNWQDSPIPLAPPELAPVSTDTRDNPLNLQPGTFGQPLVNIVSPTALPDPTGLAAALNAIQNGNMFRDMSGLAATIGMLQSTVQGTTQAAGQAAQQAGQNMANTQQFLEAMGQLALQAYGLSLQQPVTPGPATRNISNAGAALNQAMKLDSQPSNASAGSRSTQVTGGSSSTPSGSPGNGDSTSSTSYGAQPSDAQPSSYTAQAMGSMLQTPAVATLASYHPPSPSNIGAAQYGPVQQIGGATRQISPGPILTDGLDVSGKDGYHPISWDQVLTRGITYSPMAGRGPIKFVLARASSGGTADTQFTAFTNGLIATATTQHVQIVVGAYHWFSAEVGFERQVAIFHAQFDPLWRSPGVVVLPPILDIEPLPGYNTMGAYLSAKGKSISDYLNQIASWISRIEQDYSWKPILYTGPYVWSDPVSSGGLGNPSDWSDYPLWLSTAPANLAPGPAVPTAWSDWDIWQYAVTESNPAATVAGITSNGTTLQAVDLDVYNCSVDELLSGQLRCQRLFRRPANYNAGT